MTVIRVTCGGCGDVELDAVDMAVRRCVETGVATYVFICPDCHMAEVRPAQDHVVEVLRSAGVSCLRLAAARGAVRIPSRPSPDP